MSRVTEEVDLPAELGALTAKLFAVKNVCETVIKAIGGNDYPTHGCMVLVVDVLERVIDEADGLETKLAKELPARLTGRLQAVKS